MLIKLFEEWLRRWEQCIETKGEHGGELKIASEFIRFSPENVEILMGAWDTL
jgi:hypothetical protein